MDQNKSPIERAFELARTGLFLTVTEIITRLRIEGYSAGSITGPLLNRQLKELMQAGKKTRWGSGRTAQPLHRGPRVTRRTYRTRADASCCETDGLPGQSKPGPLSVNLTTARLAEWDFALDFFSEYTA
jgi:hypothetical protein